jgi:hypothetical protein
MHMCELSKRREATKMSYQSMVGTNAAVEDVRKVKKGREGECRGFLKRRVSMVSLALEWRGGD